MGAATAATCTPVPAADAVAAAAATGAAPARRASVPSYQASLVPDLDAFLARCQTLDDGTGLPFHHTHWLRAWYQTLGREPGCAPVLVAVRRTGQTGDALLLPLVMRRHHGVRCLMYADAGVVDYTGPVVAADWAGGADEAAAAQALWAALRAVLPGDMLRIDKMLARGLAETGHRANPLSLVLPVQVSGLWGNQFTVAADWEGWRRSLDKRVRKEIERCWRVFYRSAEARFERITDSAQAAELFAVLEQQQSQRLTALGVAYRLDQPAYRAFYRQLLTTGLADGVVVLSALRDGPHVVSALFGVANRQRYIGLRQSLGGDAWKTCSPGRLLDEQTARHMHEHGHQHFDFGVGDYFHKTTLQMTQIPLLEACVALTPLAWPVVFAWQLKRWLKRRPWAVSAWRRWQDLRSPARPAQNTSTSTSASASAAADSADRPALGDPP